MSNREKYGQAEYEIKLENILSYTNLFTLRNVITTNLFNIFKDEKNLNINLIYNSHRENNSNYDSHLGKYFNLDIQEYIYKVGNLTYYIDRYNRAHFFNTYYEENYFNNKKTEDDANLKLVEDNRNNKIYIKKENEILTFELLNNESTNFLYYVLTKREIKLSNNSSVVYFYNYLNNRLVSITNSSNPDNIINVEYNSDGLLKKMKLELDGLLYQIKITYDDYNNIVKITKTAKSIDKISIIYKYDSSERVKYVIDNNKKEGLKIDYDNDGLETKTIETVFLKYKLNNENDIYSSEYTYTSDLDYTRSYKFNITQLEETVDKIIKFTKNNLLNYTQVEIKKSNNEIINTYVYYYNSFGKKEIRFEAEFNEDGTINNLKNDSFEVGYEILGSNSNPTLPYTINGKNPYFIEFSNRVTWINTQKFQEFKNYHRELMNVISSNEITYNITFLLNLGMTISSPKINFYINYSDSSQSEFKISLDSERRTLFGLYSKVISLKSEEIDSIGFEIDNGTIQSNSYITHMCLSLSNHARIYVKKNNNLYDFDLVNKIKYTLYNDTVLEEMIFDSENYMDLNDFIYTYRNYIKEKIISGLNDFDLVYSNNKKKIRVKNLTLLINELEIPVDNHISYIQKNYNSLAQNIHQSEMSFKRNVSIDEYNLENVYWNHRWFNDESIDEYYDIDGRRLLKVDENGNIKYTSFMSYDKKSSETVKTIIGTYNTLYEYQNNIETVIDNISCTRNKYNEIGKLVENEYKSFHDNEMIRYEYKYDSFDRLKKIGIEDNNNYISYDNRENICKEYNYHSNKINNHLFNYDNKNRLANYYNIESDKLRGNEVEALHIDYDDTSNTITKTIDTISYKYEYDKYDNCKELCINNDDALKIEYLYDEKERLIKEKDNSINKEISYTYDNNNRVNNITIRRNNNLQAIINSNNDNNKYSYSIVNNTTHMYNYIDYYYSDSINPKLERISTSYYDKTYAYDILNRLDCEEVDIYGLRYSKQYDYLSLENDTLITPLVKSINNESTNNQNGLKIKENITYGKYNNISNVRILSERKNINSNIFNNKFEYEYTYNTNNTLFKSKRIRYNIDNDIIDSFEESFTYDNFGNIISKNIINNTLNYSINYTYSNDNKITQIEYENTIIEYTYSNLYTNIKYYNNNILYKEEKLFFTYFNELERIQKYENNTLVSDYKYYYDLTGIRYKKKNLITNSEINYIYQDNKLLYSDNGIFYLYEGNELIGFRYNYQTYLYLKDITKTIYGLSVDGKEVARYIYDAYGKVYTYSYDNNYNLILNNDSSFIGNINPFRYRGYYYDKETQLFYCNSRYYSPELCRFISPDSIEYLDPESINGLNLYCYCMNNPIMYADPSGHMPEWLDWNWDQFKRGLITVGIAAATVATIAIVSVVTFGSATPVLIGAAIGAGVSAGVSAGGQYLTTGSINIGQLLTDMSVGAVSGAFGGTALGHGGMFLSGFGTGFAGSIAEDLVKTGSIADVRLGAAIWSGLLGGALSGITTGAQNKQFASLSKFNNRIKVCKSKGITNSYFTKAIKKSSALVRSANMAVIKSIPQTIGSTIIDFYW